MSARCLVGIHRRIGYDTGNVFVMNAYRCTRCGGTWSLVTVGFNASWIRSS